MTAACIALCLAASPWEVSQNRSLLWDGKPWIPVGVEVEGTAAAVQSAVASGVTDLMVSVPADGHGWSEAAKAAAGARYAVRIAAEWPGADAWLVAPQHLRRPDPPEGEIMLSVPGASEVFAVVARNRDRSVAWSARVPAKEGTVVLNPGREGGEGRTLLLYPRFASSRLPDLGARLDARRDEVLRWLRPENLGGGARAVVNPAGSETGPYPASMMAKAAGDLDNAEFAAFLEQKYGTVAAAVRSWGLSTNDVESFATLARLVPLWTQGRGVASLWDPVADRLYSANDASSSAWADVAASRAELRRSRLSGLVAAVRQASGLPVVIESSSFEPVGQDGVGLPAHGSNGPALLDSCAVALAGAMASGRRFVWATGVALEDMGVQPAWSALSSDGVRGAFFRPRGAATLAEVVAAASAADDDVDAWSLKLMAFPPEMLGEVFASRAGGDTLWLPHAGSGRMLRLAGTVRGYLAAGPQGQSLVVWREGEEAPVRFRCADSRPIAAHSAANEALPLRKGKNFIELKLGPSPVKITGFEAAPVPEESLAYVVDVATIVLDRFGQWIDVSGTERQRLRTAVTGMGLDPLGAYEALDAMARKLTVQCAPYAWISLDRVESGDLATGVAMPGAAFGRAAAAAAGWPGQRLVSESSWSFDSKVEGDFEAWLATDARPEVLGRIEAVVRGTTLRPAGPASGCYGGGFCWIPLGPVKLERGLVPVTVRVLPGPPAAFHMDTLVVAPRGFVPEGARPPTAFLRG